MKNFIFKINRALVAAKKQKLFTLFLALVASVGTIFAERVQIGDLYYNLNPDDLTAEVTYKSYKSYNATTYMYNEDWSITTATIPSAIEYNSVTYSVTSIGHAAFGYCSGLTSITIPNSVTSIEQYAFYACTALTSVTIPNSVTSIGKYAFYGCKGLTSVTIGNSVTSIGLYAFGNCTGLTSVTIGNSVTSIGNYAFAECSGLTSITIPNSVTSIGDHAFDGCSGLTSITIPNSVTSIGRCAFSNCSGLTSIVVASGNIKYDSRENCNAIIETSSNTLIAGCKNTIIPNSVTSIGYGAFYECTGLTSITVPNSVTSIGNYAFYECSGLTSIEIPNSVTSIGNYAFYECSGLTSVTIGNSVTSIGERAFSNCTALTSITIPNSVTRIDIYAFENCIGLTSVTNYATTPQTITSNDFYNVDLSSRTLYVPKGSVDRYKAAGGWKDFGSILPISAEKTEVTTPTIEPDVTSAEIAWPQVTDAYTYELVIKDASGNTICTLVFNAQGQLTSITFNAPARENAEQQTQSAGFVFTVNGLEPGTQYNYSIIAKNESGATLKTEQGTFTTKSLEGIENVNQQSTIKNKKFLRDGQVLILRGNKTYTLQGQEVR